MHGYFNKVTLIFEQRLTNKYELAPQNSNIRVISAIKVSELKKIFKT